MDHWNVWFGQEAYTAAEGGAAARVSIHLDAPVEIAPLDVRLTLRYGGGATAADHRSIPAVVTFALGERTKTITVTATDDSADDDGESVALWFGNPPNGRVSIGDGPITATVALQDNDGVEPVTVAFGAATYRATEGGSDATVRVELDTAPGRSVTVPLTKATRGGATAADYSGIPETVTFGASQTARTFTVDRDRRLGRRTAARACRSGSGRCRRGCRRAARRRRPWRWRTTAQLRSVVVNFGTSTSVAPRVREGVRYRFTLSLDSIPLRPVTIPLRGDAPGRRDGGGLRGAPGERDVRAEREAGGLHPARGAGPAGRDRRGPADRHRPAAAGGAQGQLGAVRNGRVRGRGPGGAGEPVGGGAVADAGLPRPARRGLAARAAGLRGGGGGAGPRAGHAGGDGRRGARVRRGAGTGPPGEAGGNGHPDLPGGRDAPDPRRGGPAGGVAGGRAGAQRHGRARSPARRPRLPPGTA